MTPEDEFASTLRESKSVKRQAAYALHESLLLRNDLWLLLQQARAIREHASGIRESAVLVRDDACRKRSALNRTLQRSAAP